MSKKHLLGITARHFWLKDRIRECILALQRLDDESEWELYLKKSLFLAQEIHYAANEWEKYYNE